MENKSTASGINTVLLLIVGLLVGGIAGYFVGYSRTATNITTGQIALNLNDVLSPENAYIVEGLSCPMAGCTIPLQTCQGELPRRIRDWVNAQLGTGRSGAEIRAEIIQTHGTNVQKLGGASVYDTIKSITD